MNDQTRSERQLLPPIESILKQMDTAGTELECFQALQKQEQLAATHRINSLWEEVQKQKELEQTLQRRYGNLVAELERIQHLTTNYRTLAKQQEEIAEKNRALEFVEIAAKQAAMQNSETSEPLPSDNVGSTVLVDSSNLAEQQTNEAQDLVHASPKHNINADSGNEHAAMDTDVSLSTDAPSVVEGLHSVNVTEADESDKEVTAQNLNKQGGNISDVVVAEGNMLNDKSVSGNAGGIAMSTEGSADDIEDGAVAEDQQIVTEATNPDGVAIKQGEIGEGERAEAAEVVKDGANSE